MRRVLVGVGNPLGRDDAVALFVADKLSGSDWMALSCSAPENVLGRIELLNPDLLVVIDATCMGLPPGSFRRLPLAWAEQMIGSSHGLPVPFLIRQIRVPRVVFIGVEPKELGFGEGLSPEVAQAVEALVGLLKQGQLEEIPEL